VEPGSGVRFERGGVYTRAEIQVALGGSRRASLPTRGGEVVCACLTRRRNPRAPQEMLVDGAERAVRLARAFAASGRAVPVFVSERPGGWEFAGRRRVRALIEEPGALLALFAEGAPPGTALALLLEEAVAAPPPGAGDQEAPRPDAAAGG
jgi:hypothetical protein